MVFVFLHIGEMVTIAAGSPTERRSDKELNVLNPLEQESRYTIKLISV